MEAIGREADAWVRGRKLFCGVDNGQDEVEGLPLVDHSYSDLQLDDTFASYAHAVNGRTSETPRPTVRLLATRPCRREGSRS